MFVLSDTIIVTALTAGTGMSFFDKCAETSVCFCENRKNHLAAGAPFPDPLASSGGVRTQPPSNVLLLC